MRPLAAGSIVVLLVLSLVQPVRAATNFSVEDDEVEASAGVSPYDGGYRGASGCSWLAAEPDELLGGGADGVIRELGGRLMRAYFRDCDGVNQTVWLPFPIPQAAELRVQLFESIKDRLHYPEPILTPLSEEHGWALVQVPLDFRTTAETVSPIVLTAAIDGPNPVWVTITATPEALWFFSGDQRASVQSTRCDISQALAPYVAETPGQCSYTYRNSSAYARSGSDVFPARMAFDWIVTYESSSGTGTIDAERTFTDVPLEVAERKAFTRCVTGDC